LGGCANLEPLNTSAEASTSTGAWQAEFIQICQDYFPRWQGMNTWVLKEGPRGSWRGASTILRTTTEQGYCDHDSKTIYVSAPPEERKATIIHEICHAVTTGGHNKQWRGRLFRAGQRARELAETALATYLEEEANEYAEWPSRGGTSLYGPLEALMSDSPS